MNKLWAALILTIGAIYVCAGAQILSESEHGTRSYGSYIEDGIASLSIINYQLSIDHALPPSTPSLPDSPPSQPAASPQDTYLLLLILSDGSILRARGAIAEKTPLKPVFRDAQYGMSLYRGWFAMRLITDAAGLWMGSGHEDLTRRACEKLGLTEKCCDAIVKHNKATDKGDVLWWLGKDSGEDSKKNHMVSGDKKPADGERKKAQQQHRQFVEDMYRKARELVKQGKTEEAYKVIWEGLHAMQDMWSHRDKNGMPSSDDDHQNDVNLNPWNEGGDADYDDPKKYKDAYDKEFEDTVFFLQVTDLPCECKE